MPEILTQQARAIARKLERDEPKRPGRQRFTIQHAAGRRHDLVKVYYGQILVGRYGIQRASKSKRHNYVAEQLYLTRKQAYDLATCPFSVDDYIDVLITKGEIESAG